MKLKRENLGDARMYRTQPTKLLNKGYSYYEVSGTLMNVTDIHPWAVSWAGVGPMPLSIIGSPADVVWFAQEARFQGCKIINQTDVHAVPVPILMTYGVYDGSKGHVRTINPVGDLAVSLTKNTMALAAAGAGGVAESSSSARAYAGTATDFAGAMDTGKGQLNDLRGRHDVTTTGKICINFFIATSDFRTGIPCTNDGEDLAFDRQLQTTIDKIASALAGRDSLYDVADWTQRGFGYRDNEVPAGELSQ